MIDEDHKKETSVSHNLAGQISLRSQPSIQFILVMEAEKQASSVNFTQLVLGKLVGSCNVREALLEGDVSVVNTMRRFAVHHTGAERVG